MGKGASKNKLKNELQCKDWKFIEAQDPSKLKYLDKWITTYNYDGRLNSQKLVNLQDAIIERTKRDLRKMDKEGYDDVDYRLKVTKKRDVMQEIRMDVFVESRKGQRAEKSFLMDLQSRTAGQLKVSKRAGGKFLFCTKDLMRFDRIGWAKMSPFGE
ncbi:hypothetical protein AMECASPLE_039625 [Ameca splendens]|uniref:Uncharacterized protein n=1 Tax=Ameca splendens TaxID=208324 RepID=A0ABV0YK69_9TELE